MAHPMLMFEPDPDMMISYNFDRLTTYDQKKTFIKKVFKNQRAITNDLFRGPIGDKLADFWKTLYQNYREDMIRELTGLMTFEKFNEYFASFFKRYDDV